MYMLWKRFTYPGRWRCFPQLVYCGEKSSNLKLVNIQKTFWELPSQLLIFKYQPTYRSNIYTKMLIINFHELKFLRLLKYEQILIKILFLFLKRKLFNIVLENTCVNFPLYFFWNLQPLNLRRLRWWSLFQWWCYCKHCRTQN